jgi:oligopeptidase A
MNSEALRAAYNTCLPLLSEYYTDLSQSEPLYRAYLHIRNREGARLDAVQRAVLERALHDFHQAGVALDGERKLRFKSIMSELAQLQAKFEENVLDATNAWSHRVSDPAQLAGVNAGIVAQAEQRARAAGVDGWIFGLDQPTYVAVVTDADSAALRRVFYEAWSTRASDRGPGAGRFDNTPVMEDILRLRHEAARLLDYPSYAEYALEDRMAACAGGQLLPSSRRARGQARAELAEAGGLRRPHARGLGPELLLGTPAAEPLPGLWEELREYLPLPRVLATLFEWPSSPTAELRERSGVRWRHPTCATSRCSRPAAPLASFYLDAYARASKRSGAWMDVRGPQDQWPAHAASGLLVRSRCATGRRPALRHTMTW